MRPTNPVQGSALHLRAKLDASLLDLLDLKLDLHLTFKLDATLLHLRFILDTTLLTLFQWQLKCIHILLPGEGNSTLATNVFECFFTIGQCLNYLREVLRFFLFWILLEFMIGISGSPPA